MSKHALEAYTDSLAAQWVGRGVHVCAVAPGNFESAILTNMLKRFVTPTGASDEALQRNSEDEDTSRSWFPSPDAVAEAVRAALFEPAPEERYLVTPDEDEAFRTLERAAWELVRLNRSTPYRLSRSRLAALLDEVEALTTEPSS
jgi:NAD(P)-dependent dehydrogenase (short-subunit alcohol dehydrogenase family)